VAVRISTHPCTLVCVRNGIGNRKGNRIGESGNLSVGCFGLGAVSSDSFGVRAPLEVGIGSLYWFDCGEDHHPWKSTGDKK
jgi:hypothetical protein